MSTVIRQAKPDLPDLRQRKWYQPVRSETLGGIADGTNNLVAVKSVGHLCHRFHWRNTSSDGITSHNVDPGATGTVLHWIYIPIRSVLSTHFYWGLFVQAHSEVSGGSQNAPFIEMVTLSGPRVIEPANGANMLDGSGDVNNAFGIRLDGVNGGLPVAEGRFEVEPGLFSYPVNEVRGTLVRTDVNKDLMPTGPRAMTYGSQAGTDTMITLLVKSHNCRPIQLSINEVAPVLVD